MNNFHWTVGSFSIFLLYIIASVQSWRVAEAVSGRERLIWLFVAGIFCVLAVNTAIDGLNKLAALFRSDAQAQGWYADRMSPQSSLIIALLAFCFIAALTVLFWVRMLPLPSQLALIALLVLMTFILVRAISLHAVDHILFARFFRNDR